MRPLVLGDIQHAAKTIERLALVIAYKIGVEDAVDYAPAFVYIAFLHTVMIDFTLDQLRLLAQILFPGLRMGDVSKMFANQLLFAISQHAAIGLVRAFDSKFRRYLRYAHRHVLIN